MLSIFEEIEIDDYSGNKLKTKNKKNNNNNSDYYK
jgi:hypothetical protein